MVTLTANGHRYDLSTARTHKMIEGIRQNKIRLATEVGLLDKVKDFLREINFPKVFKFLNDPVKQKELTDLYNYLKTNTEINYPEDSESYTTLKDNQADLRAITVCMVISSMFDNQRNIKFEVEHTKYGFNDKEVVYNTGEIIYSINGEEIWKSKGLGDLGYIALLSLDKISDKNGKLKIDTSNINDMKEKLKSLYQALAENFSNYKANIELIKTERKSLHYRLYNPIFNKDSDKFTVNKLKNDGKKWLKIFKAFSNENGHDINKIPIILEEFTNFMKSTINVLEEHEFDLIMFRLERANPTLMKQVATAIGKEVFAHVETLAITNSTSTMLSQRLSIKNKHPQDIYMDICSLIDKLGNHADKSGEMHFDEKEEDLVLDAFKNIEKELIFVDGFGQIDFKKTGRSYLFDGYIEIENGENFAQKIFLYRSPTTDSKLHHPNNKEYELDVERTLNKEFCQEKNNYDKKIEELFDKVCNDSFSNIQKRLFHTARAYLWRNQLARYSYNALNLDPNASVEILLNPTNPDKKLAAFSKIIRSSIKCRELCFEQALKDFPELKEFNKEVATLGATQALTANQRKIQDQINQVKAFFLDPSYTW